MAEEVELCQAFSEALLTVQDVDENDDDQPQLCSQYVRDIYNYLHDLEVKALLTAESHCEDVALTWSVSAGAAGCASKLHAGL